MCTLVIDLDVLVELVIIGTTARSVCSYRRSEDPCSPTMHIHQGSNMKKSVAALTQYCEWLLIVGINIDGGELMVRHRYDTNDDRANDANG